MMHQIHFNPLRLLLVLILCELVAGDVRGQLKQTQCSACLCIKHVVDRLYSQKSRFCIFYTNRALLTFNSEKGSLFLAHIRGSINDTCILMVLKIVTRETLHLQINISKVLCCKIRFCY